jgi:hypothetical protein
MAAADSPGSFASAAQGAVFPNGLDEVFRTTRLKTTNRRQDGPQARLVKSHSRDEQR